jgi:hypothetical protein
VSRIPEYDAADAFLLGFVAGTLVMFGVFVLTAIIT